MQNGGPFLCILKRPMFLVCFHVKLHNNFNKQRLESGCLSAVPVMDRDSRR